jgi:hypothetical protein
MSYDRAPSITLLELWERRSAKNNLYFSGFLGGLQVALLRDGERPHPTRPDETITVWRLVASERQPRDGAPKAAARPPERDPAPGPLAAASVAARVLEPPGRRSGASAARARGPGRSGCRPRSRAATGSRPIRTTRSRSEVQAAWAWYADVFPYLGRMGDAVPQESDNPRPPLGLDTAS